MNVLRCRTRAPAADEAAGRLRSVPAGAAISLLGAAARIFGVRAQGVGSRAAAAVPSCPRRATRAFPRGAPDRSTRWRRGSLPNPNPNSALGETRPLESTLSPGESSNVQLDLALLFFLQQFRKVYLGEQPTLPLTP